MKKIILLITFIATMASNAWAQGCVYGNCQNGYGKWTGGNGNYYEGYFKNGLFHGQGTLTWVSGSKYVGQWKEGLKDGQGTFTGANGDKYVGQFKEDRSNGQGTLTRANGDKYVGQFKESKLDGQGTFTWAYGAKYVGQWKEDKKDGQGTLTDANGDKYVGQWKEDKPNGQGTWTCADGDKYVGQWKEDLKDGHGTYTWASGNKYVGQWKEGKRDGQGTFTWASGSKYVGQFKESKLDGQGTYTWADGTKYVGQYKEDKKDGQGTYTWADGTKYVGQWKEDKKDGQGTLTLANGNKYVGQWKEDKFDGQGTYTWADGAKYVGQWKEDNRDGQGTMTWADGTKYVGQYKEDNRDGQGTMTWANGTSLEGIWNNEGKDCEGTQRYPNGNYAIGTFERGQGEDNKRYERQVSRYLANGEPYFGTWLWGVVPNLVQKQQHPNGIAVIIGNKNYESAKEVNFALSDAQKMKDYLIHTLGYLEANIFYIENATKSKFDVFFGTESNFKGKLYNAVKPNISDVFIYYAGHGAPSLNTKKGYFVPVDCEPMYVEQGGYSLDVFYKNIAKIPAKSFTIITDACFSGADVLENISPVEIRVVNDITTVPNSVILSSSRGTQASCWYNEKGSSMLTYFFLKAIEDKDKSDTNKDNKLTYRELYNYINDRAEGVPYYSRRIHGVSQDPTMEGSGLDKVMLTYK